MGSQHVKRRYETKPWPSIEFRALRFERRSWCVWTGFEARLRRVYHGFAQDANVVILASPGSYSNLELSDLRGVRVAFGLGSRCV